MQRPVVVLPLPDSPTSPNVSPFSIEKLTSSTACTTELVPKSPLLAAELLERWRDLEQRHQRDLLGGPRGRQAAAHFRLSRAEPVADSSVRPSCAVADDRVSPGVPRRTARTGAGSAARTRSRAAGGRAAARCPESPAASIRARRPGSSQQPARIGMARIAEQLAHRRFLDDPSGVHHRHAVGHLGDDARGRA